MDLDEWEILSHEAFIDLHENQEITHKSNTIIDMDYFQRCVPIKYDMEVEKFEGLPIESSSSKDDDYEIKDENFNVLDHKSDDQEMISKVFFKKLNEKNEFVDMKLDSPKSLNKGIMYQFDQKVEKDCYFDEENQELDEKFVVFEEKKVNIDKKVEKDGNFDEKKLEEDEKLVVYEEKSWKNGDENEGVNIWKWAMNGMGALVTFGFAAATVSLIVFSNRHKENNDRCKKQDLRFQIYTHDKRFKQVVRRAKRLNEAISVMRGAPLTRAHITVGGYYEAV